MVNRIFECHYDFLEENVTARIQISRQVYLSVVDRWYSGAYSKGWFTSSCVLALAIGVLNDISATLFIQS